MRYEIGVLRLLVASVDGGGPAQPQLVARALGRSPSQLQEALAYLREQGLVDEEGQPTKAGRMRAAKMNAQQFAEAVLKMASLAQLLPPPLPVLRVPTVAIHHDDFVDVRDSEVQELRGTG